MVRIGVFSLLFAIATASPVRAQESRSWRPSVALESYLLEYYDMQGTNYAYTSAGHALSVRYTCTVSDHWELGAIAGLYFVGKKGYEGQPNNYLYLPVQAAATYRTLGDRFQLEIATGYPLRLKEYADHINVDGFWYADIDPASSNYEEKTDIHRHKMFLISNLRLKFRIREPIWFTTGVRHTLYSFYNIYSPDNIRTPRNYMNLSFGLEYRFREKPRSR